jgi:hypothetical protein
MPVAAKALELRVVFEISCMAKLNCLVAKNTVQLQK